MENAIFMTQFGILNLNKPSGMTSRQAVDRVARFVRPSKAGHAGTLDPLASGVLVVCVGPATKLIQYVQQTPKRYLATFLLGRQSPTEDAEGEITVLPDAPVPTLDLVHTAAKHFVGQIEQRPPAYSAIKVQGQRAYRLARRGQTVELKPRPITVESLTVVRYDYPELVVDLCCSAGTYVRSLGRDLAETLDTAAVMSKLVRTAVGPFRLETATAVNDLTPGNLAQALQPARMAVPGLPSRTVSPSEISELSHGRSIPGRMPEGTQEVAALDEAGMLVAILVSRGPNQLGPVRNFI